ncbi:hypothetical protein ACFOUV_15700 [Oceanobacillus longus]|uniref:Uncharacterized protein n=1 Tax=Oceanobacillus longus TaxID=930120 RepID=A0ABV8H2Y9_9BACI
MITSLMSVLGFFIFIILIILIWDLFTGLFTFIGIVLAVIVGIIILFILGAIIVSFMKSIKEEITNKEDVPSLIYLPVVRFRDDLAIIIYAVYKVISHIDDDVKGQAHERMKKIFGEDYDDGQIDEDLKPKSES